jgi:NADH-quinone oxidoreductase subunit A
VPATAGKLGRDPVWARYHVRYYGYALLFLAFDMEMAYMYP